MRISNVSILPFVIPVASSVNEPSNSRLYTDNVIPDTRLTRFGNPRAKIYS